MARIEPIQSPDDPRIQAFFSLKARTQKGEPQLVADGKRVLVNLIKAEAPIRSVLCEESSLDEIQALLDSRPKVTIYSAPSSVIQKIVGYDFHQGVMASLEHPGTVDVPGLGLRVVVLCGLDKGENVGAVIRNCAAFGVDSLVMGPGCATPFQRNAIRASRGFVFGMKIHESPDLADTLARMKDRGYKIFATNQTPDSMPVDQVDPGEAWALLLGNEGHGLPSSVQKLADRAITIPMAPKADSLNVAAASAVILSRWFKT